ncbi:hypothetical protein [Burkholderia pyrrocinia]
MSDHRGHQHVPEWLCLHVGLRQSAPDGVYLLEQARWGAVTARDILRQYAGCLDPQRIQAAYFGERDQ